MLTQRRDAFLGPAWGGVGSWCYPRRLAPKGSSSIGRAPVSKTGGWGFKSLLPCSLAPLEPEESVNRQTKRMMQRQGQMETDGTPAPRTAQPRPAPRPASQRTSPAQFLREVRGELRKVAWPSRSEVVNYSSVVFITLVLLVSFIFVLNFAFAKAVIFLFKK